MNFNPELGTGTAIFMSLFAAALWGTWFIALKYLGDYPLDGFYVTLFSTAVVFVWAVGLWIDGPALTGNLREVYATDPGRIWVSLLCGFLYVLGMRLSLTVISKIGLSLAQPIQSSVFVLAGTLVAALVGGIPENLSVSRLALACLLLVGAVVVSMAAGTIRSKSAANSRAVSGLEYTNQDMLQSLGLLLVSSAFIPAYTFGLSYGLRSITHPAGLAVLPFMALLSTGAFAGSMATSGISLARSGQWKKIFQAPLPIHSLGMLAGLFHYGGNIIHTFATASLSSAISWPLGITSGLWTQLWGLVYGEFRGAPRLAYIALFAGIALYLAGAYLIAFR